MYDFNFVLFELGYTQLSTIQTKYGCELDHELFSSYELYMKLSIFIHIYRLKGFTKELHYIIRIYGGMGGGEVIRIEITVNSVT